MALTIPTNQERKGVAILGATGSVGTQALEVIRNHPDQFNVCVLTAYSNLELLISQALEFKPRKVVIGNAQKYTLLKEALSGTGIQVYAGLEALVEVVQYEEVDVVLTAMVGAAGLEPTVAAIRAGKDIALANKETLVVGGSLVMELARQHQVRILPVDSEHSAIFQCLVGENSQHVEKIYLTASGGPFRGWTRQQLTDVSVEKALQHPNWSMGAKITIDSASLMNKGLEVIEAKWLFELDIDQIDVIIHPQSIIHSMVQYQDGSIMAQMGLPDMKLPIQYALTYPNRDRNQFKRLNFAEFSNLTFQQPDRTAFRNLDLAYQALEKGGNMPCVLNAANEIVVAAFLKEELSFLAMSDVIEETMSQIALKPIGSVADCLETDRHSRAVASELVRKISDLKK